MVATRLQEVASKGYEWAYGGSTTETNSPSRRRSGSISGGNRDPLTTPKPITTTKDINKNNENPSSPSSSFSSPTALWDAASTAASNSLASAGNSLASAGTSLSSAADSAYNTLAGVANYATTTMTMTTGGRQDANNKNNIGNSSSALNNIIGGGGDDGTTMLPHHQSSSSWLQNVVDRRNQFEFGSPLKLHNPYNRVRGRYAYQDNHQSSMSAVRSLLPLVVSSTDDGGEDEDDLAMFQVVPEMVDDSNQSSSRERLMTGGEGEEDCLELSTTPGGAIGGNNNNKGQQPSYNNKSPLEQPPPPPPPTETPLMSSASSAPASRIHKNSETASQLAEGTVRALRDIALDEAVELYSALRFWSERWEHPLLSWLEAGPTVWFSRDGYDHQLVGQKVAQIQAVLARRCVVIGELQQHLLRAGWQRGVAQWGVLGQGGQWATVQGTYVMTEDTAALSQRELIGMNNDPTMNNRTPKGSNRKTTTTTTSPSRRDIKKWKREKGYYASIFVRNEKDGRIHMDDAALAEWSIDAMALIRDLLTRASGGKVGLPYEHHWKLMRSNNNNNNPITPSAVPAERESSFSEQGELIVEAEPPQPPDNDTADDAGCSRTQEGLDARQLPVWASWASKVALGNSYEFDPKKMIGDDDNVVISNLPLMAAEVSGLLDSIEEIMSVQKSRRMRKLQPPSMIRRRWYLTVVAAPGLTYLAHYLSSHGFLSKMIRVTFSKIVQFFEERVVIPFVAIIQELIKGREDISDKKARIEVIAALKEMIRSWLDENHPEIPAAERLKMAELMDISLIERQKTESMKTLFEINQAVRLTFIEMQFIKKEMVNALYTMDDMMTKNEINTNLAAVTPAVLLLYTAKQVFRFFYYALLKLGKSREETYASFRQILTDIERLLVMRDNPPSSPFPNHNARHASGDTEDASQSQFNADGRSSGCDVLSADDLGMLLLHIHECRTILWRNHNRFKAGMIQSVSEDLAELAGERGAVSVQQQLQITARMCRTYPFLKVISIGTTFHERFIGSSA